MPATRKGPDGRPLLTLILGLAALGALGWYLFAPGPSEERSEEEGEAYLYWYCQRCSLEMTCGPGDEKKVILCPRCGTKVVNMAVYDYSHKNGEKVLGLRSHQPFAVLIFLTATLAVALAFFSQWRSRPGPAESPSTPECACPVCDYRMPCSPADAGRRKRCPACDERFIVPALEPREAPEPSPRQEEDPDVKSWWEQTRKARGRKRKG